MTIFQTIGQSASPIVFSAGSNALVLLISGFFLMIDVVGYHGGSDHELCRVLSPWAFVVTFGGVILGLYAFFASAAGGNKIQDGQDQQTEAFPPVGNININNNDPYNNNNNNPQQQQQFAQEFRPPYIYMTLLLVISVINLILAIKSLDGADFCSGRLNMLWPLYSVASMIIAPATILSLPLLFLRRKQLFCINLIQARYWINNLLIVSFTWMIWFSVPCAMCKMKDDGDYEQEYRNNNLNTNKNNNNNQSSYAPPQQTNYGQYNQFRDVESRQ